MATRQERKGSPGSRAGKKLRKQLGNEDLVLWERAFGQFLNIR